RERQLDVVSRRSLRRVAPGMRSAEKHGRGDHDRDELHGRNHCGMGRVSTTMAIAMPNLLIDLDREMASTRRLLERYPSGHGEWRPHEKSRTLSALATH